MPIFNKAIISEKTTNPASEPECFFKMYLKNELDDASMNKNEQIIILVIGVMLAYLLFVTVMTIIDLSFQRSKHKKILKKISKESHKKLHELKS